MHSLQPLNHVASAYLFLLFCTASCAPFASVVSFLSSCLAASALSIESLFQPLVLNTGLSHPARAPHTPNTCLGASAFGSGIHPSSCPVWSGQWDICYRVWAMLGKAQTHSFIHRCVIEHLLCARHCVVLSEAVVAMADPQRILEPSMLFPCTCVQHLDILSGRGLLTHEERSQGSLWNSLLPFC